MYALLALVEEAELRPLVGIYDGEDASDALADVMDASELGGTSSDLASPERNQLSAIRQNFAPCLLVCSIGRPTISTPATGCSAPPWTCSTAGWSSTWL